MEPKFSKMLAHNVPAARTFLTEVALDITRPFFRPEFTHFTGIIYIKGAQLELGDY